MSLQYVYVVPEIPGSLVSEPKHRDSRFKSRLGIGIEIKAWKVSESVSDQKSDIPSLRIRARTKTQTFQVLELEPESRQSKSRNRNRNPN